MKTLLSLITIVYIKKIVLLLMIILVSSIDVRLQGVEKSVGKFDEIKTMITSLSSRVVSVKKKHNKLSDENYRSRK